MHGPGPEPAPTPDIMIMNLPPELTRGFRGLHFWLPLQRLGAAPFQQQLTEKMELARHAANAIDNSGVPGHSAIRLIIGRACVAGN